MNKKTRFLSFLIMLIILAGVFASSFSAVSTFDGAARSVVMMYVNRPNVWRFGTVGYISSDRKQMPYYSSTGNIMVPVSYFAGCFGGSAESSATSTKVTVSGKTFSIASENRNGVNYASVTDLCKKSGKYLHLESNGLFAFGDENVDAFLNWTTHLKEMRNLVQSFIFDTYTGDDIYSALVRTTGNTHPRLIYTDAEFAEIRRRISNSKADYYDLVYDTAFGLLKGAAGWWGSPGFTGFTYSITDGIRLDNTSDVRTKIIAPALLYNLIGNDTEENRGLRQKYAEQAYSVMEQICQFDNLNPYHFLDVGQISFGLAFGYDLLYYWMNPDQRYYIMTRIMDLVVEVALYDVRGETRLGNPDDSERSSGTVRSSLWNKEGEASNWRFVVGAGVGCSVLAIITDLGVLDTKKSIEVLGAMLNYLQPELMLFAPEGGYEEGMAYWEFGLTYYAMFMKALIHSCGTDFGYVDLPGMRTTGDYLVAMHGSADCFTHHHDVKTRVDDYPSALMFFGDYFGKYEQGALRTELIKNYTEDGPIRYWEDAALDFILYSPSLRDATTKALACDGYFSVSEDAVMRTGWGSDDIYLGFHCDRPYGNGGSGSEPYDSGTFVLQGLGESWFFDQDRDNYELSPIYNTYWYRSEGHNTVIFNPDSKPEMVDHAEVYISDFSGSNEVSYAVGNMTKAYSSNKYVNSFNRGVKLNKEIGVVTVQDEIVLSRSASNLYWFAHTDAQISVSSDGKTATLTKNGKKLNAKIVSGNATFSVMDAKPLSTSPKVSGQRTLDGVRKLTIRLQNTDKNINLCVQFNFGEGNKTFDEYLPIEEWSSSYSGSNVTETAKKIDRIIDFEESVHDLGSAYDAVREKNKNLYVRLKQIKRNRVVFKPAGSLPDSAFMTGQRWVWSFDLLIDPSVDTDRISFLLGNACIQFNDGECIDVQVPLSAGGMFRAYAEDSALINGWNHISISMDVLEGGSALYKIFLNGKKATGWRDNSSGQSLNISDITVPNFMSSDRYGVPDGLEMEVDRTIKGTIGLDNIRLEMYGTMNDSKSVKVIYVPNEETTVYSFEIVWGSLEYKYTEESAREWDPYSHTYSEDAVEGGWSVSEGADQITVTNHSNADAYVNVVCEMLDKYDTVTHKIYTQDGKEKNYAKLMKGDNTDFGHAYYEKFRLELSGDISAPKGMTRVGTVTVSIYPTT